MFSIYVIVLKPFSKRNHPKSKQIEGNNQSLDADLIPGFNSSYKSFFLIL